MVKTDRLMVAMTQMGRNLFFRGRCISDRGEDCKGWLEAES